MSDSAAQIAAPEPLVPGSGGGLNESSLPKSTPDTQSDIFKSGEVEQGIRPTRWEAFKERLSEGLNSGPSAQLGNAIIEYDAQNRADRNQTPKMSPEDLNKAFPGMPQAFSEPTDPTVAAIKYNNYQRIKKSQEWVNRGGPAPFQDFTSGLATGFLDPLNMSLGLATGGLSSAAKLSGSLRNVFLQNLAINSATGAFSYAQENTDQLNPSASDAAVGAIEGSLGGTAFHFASQAFAGLLSKGLSSAMDYVRRTPDDIRVDNTKRAVMANEAGVRVDVTPGMIESAARMRGEMEGQTSPYRFSEVSHPSERSYFAGRDGSGNHSDSVNLGPGVQALDDGVAMNHLAATGSEEPGRVGRIDPSGESKFLDIEQPAKSPEFEDAVKQIEEKTGIKINVQDGETIKDVITRLGDMAATGEAPNDIQGIVQDIAKSEGFDGYKFIGKDPETGAPMHNGIHLFDESTVPSEQYLANKDIVPRISDDQKQVLTQEGLGSVNSPSYTPEIAKEVRDMKHGHSFNSTPDYMDPFVKQQYESAKNQLAQLAETSPSAKEALDLLRRSDATGKQELDLMKKIADCAGQGIA